MAKFVPSSGFADLAYRVDQGEFRCLSIRQPWVHHILHDGKDIENRDWPTRHRGWTILHASASKAEIDPGEAKYPLGGICGMARIVGCTTHSDSQWFNGPFGFELLEAFEVPFIPLKGRLNFFPLYDLGARVTLSTHLRKMAMEAQHVG
jgi:hypothetical protein